MLNCHVGLRAQCERKETKYRLLHGPGDPTGLLHPRGNTSSPLDYCVARGIGSATWKNSVMISPEATQLQEVYKMQRNQDFPLSNKGSS